MNLKKRQNIFEMYMANGCRFGFYVHRDSWRSDRYAKVVGIDGVEDGKPIDGQPPYFNRTFPSDNANAGKIWSRKIYLEAEWFDDGTYATESGGTYGWTKVDLVKGTTDQ
jgi:hypothetical protein